MRAFAIIAVAACSGASPPTVAHETPAAWHARPMGGTRAIDPGVPATSELLDAQACKQCHAPIVDEWAQSRHALAWTAGIFQHEYSARPQPWCVNCHAPLTTQQAGTHMNQGVDCATCHVRSGKLVSKQRGATSPHDTVADTSFGSPAFCADCHEFTFPRLDDHGIAFEMTRYPMQNTVTSFRDGPYGQERDGCMTCHGSRTNHAFAGGHDAGMREAAAEVSWCKRGESLDLGVRNANAGHNVPTGDIHRHMYLRVWRSTAPEAMFQAFFGRRFEPVDSGGKRTIWDSTIAPNETKRFAVAVADLAGDDDEPINLELVYIYVEHEDRPNLEPTKESLVRRRMSLAEIADCQAGVPSTSSAAATAGRAAIR